MRTRSCFDHVRVLPAAPGVPIQMIVGRRPEY